MADELSAPTAEYLADLATELGDRYHADDLQIDGYRAQREMRVPAMNGADEKYTLVNVDPRDPDVSEEAFQQTAMLTLERPKLQLKGGESDTAQTNASLREHWTEETLWEAGTRTPGKDTMVALTDAALNDGGAWAKILFAPDVWDKRYSLPRPGGGASQDVYDHYDKATEEAKKAAGVPFVWSAVDTRTVYPDTAGGQLCEVLEVTERPLRATLRRYRLGRDRQGDLVPEELAEPQATSNRPILPSSLQLWEHWDETFCFPADTLVESDSDLAGAYKRWYEGELLTIRTARGHQLSGTPNHPVMTERGWVPLGQLKQGDRVVSRTFSERAAAGNPDPQHRQAPIGEVFGFLQGLGVGQRRMGSVQDFHGDGQDRSVDVVRTERVLWQWIRPALSQPADELRLATTDQVQGQLVGSGLLGQRGCAPRFASDRGMSLLRRNAPPGALLRRHTFPPDLSRGFVGAGALAGAMNDGVYRAWVAPERSGNLDGRLLQVEIPVQHVDRVHEPFTLAAQGGDFTLTSHRSASGLKTAADGARMDAERASDLDTGLTTFDVALDDVVHVERKQWAGHVFNLESIGHTYSANGIIVHNCTWCVATSNYAGHQTRKIVKQFRHGYGFVPYDFAPGLWMNHWSNRKVGWGVSQTKLWLVQYRQYLRAMHAQYVARDLLSPLVNYGEAGAAPVIGNDGKPRDRDPGPIPGEILNLGPGRQLQRIQYPDATTLEKHMQLVDNAIMQLESPKVTTLGGMEGAGFAISQVLSYSRTRVGPISSNLQSLLKGQTEKLWSLVQNKVQEKVWVGFSGPQGTTGYIGLDPDDFNRPVRIQWQMQQQLPTDDMIKARYAHERLQAGTWGSDEAIEYLGDNPDEIRRSKQRDRIRQSPEYQKWLDNQVFQFAGRGDILGAAAQAQQLAMKVQPALPAGPGGMATPAPGVFEGGGAGAGGVPDLGALAAAPNGAGVMPPPGPAVMQGAAANVGAPGAGGP